MRILSIALLLMVIAAFAFAITQAEITEAEDLINSNKDCSSLSSAQLDLIGEYIMERMHPGEAHELMDEMMGGEGSDGLKQMHVQMARRLYCKEDVGGMMGSGGMRNMMMGNNSYGGIFGWNIFEVLLLVLLVGLIVLVYLNIWKKAKENGKVKK